MPPCTGGRQLPTRRCASVALLPTLTLAYTSSSPLHADCQVFYHLGDLDDALSYALGAGPLFDVAGTSEYVQTILGERCCDYQCCGCCV